MAFEILGKYMEAAVEWTFVVICISFWAVGMISIWKWFLAVLRRMLHHLFPGFRRKHEVNDDV